jgi:hypothetical protein
MEKTKKYFIFLFLIILIFPSITKGGEIDIWGTTKIIDTLECKQVGPGIIYTRFELPEYPLSAYLLTIDLNDSNNFIETFQAENQVGKTELMTKAYHRLNYEGHSTIAGVNGNFWVVSGQNQPPELLGIPYSGSMMNEEMITMPSSWNRGRATTPEDLLQEIGFAVIDTNKNIWIDDMGFDGKVIINGVGEYPISEINRIRNNNQIVFFNKFMGSVPTRSDDNGIEVFIKPKDGERWRVNEEVTCEVVKIIRDKGGNLINSDESVLSGSGAGKTFLENLSVGQTVKVNMNIFTLKNSNPVPAKEMITGNALVLKDGILTVRNTNEVYNSQLYPRTGIGMSQDGKKVFLIVIDKYGKSVGANTTTMCGILKSFGAWNVASMDGGGSAQMMLNGNIVNNPADGKERAVANGWFVYHNAPEDNTITKIEFADYKIEVPCFASYQPVILGYNQYGVLVNENLSGVKLSCDEGLGHIENENIFVAGANTQNGLLTANYNGIMVSKSINTIPSEIFLRLDSVLVDHRTQYPIEVLSQNDKTVMKIPPSALSWIIRDPEICSIDENGHLKGLKNGSTTVVGTLGDFKDSLKVIVEIPTSGRMIGDNFDVENWTLTASAPLNAVLNTENLPSNWTHGAAVNYVYTSTRAPFIKLLRNAPMYGLPDTLKLIVNVGDINITKALLSLRANNATVSASKEFTTIPKNTDTELSVAMSELFDATDIAIYPVWFDNINFYLGAQTSGQAYTLALKEIVLCYKGVEISGLPSVLLSKYEIFPNPLDGTILNIRTKNNDVNLLQAQLFHLNGQCVVSQQLNPVNGMATFKVGKLPAGTFLLKIRNKETSETINLLIK